MKKVIVTGATGMVGKGVLLECLDHPQIGEVLSISRNLLDLEHPKLRQLIHSDFSNFDGVADQLRGFDACFMCMGISSAGMNEEEFSKLTFTYTIALAKAAYQANPQMTVTYVSGEGTDSTEKGKIMWARVKGRTENTLLNMGFKQAYMFRPGAIIPLRGITSKTRLYQFMYDYFTWLIKILQSVSPNSVTDTTKMGLAMINALLYGYPTPILVTKDINLLASK
jgi:uncharacterized protein YbjT (DUF2867 family)